MCSWDGTERRNQDKGDASLLERIHSIETEVSGLSTKIQTFLEYQTKVLETFGEMAQKHDRAINGEHNVPGLREEINALKTIEGQRKAHLNALTFACIAAVVNMVFGLIKKLFNQ